MDATSLMDIRLVTTTERGRYGWPLDSCFIEEFWLPILGPSSVVLLRWVARHADELTRYPRLPLAELASAIGLGCGIGRHSAICRTLERITRFHVARWDVGPDVNTPQLSVYSHLLPVPRRLVAQLPPAVQADHARAVSALARRRHDHRRVARAAHRVVGGPVAVAHRADRTGPPRDARRMVDLPTVLTAATATHFRRPCSPRTSTTRNLPSSMHSTIRIPAGATYQRSADRSSRQSPSWPSFAASLYRTGWAHTAGPTWTARPRFATRHVPGRGVFAGYDLGRHEPSTPVSDCQQYTDLVTQTLLF